MNLMHLEVYLDFHYVHNFDHNQKYQQQKVYIQQNLKYETIFFDYSSVLGYQSNFLEKFFFFNYDFQFAFLNLLEIDELFTFVLEF